MKNLDSEMEILHWEKPLKTIKSTQCLKIPEKSLIYILGGQKLIKNAKNEFGRIFENL